jgi:hypothetical protein
MRNGKSTTTTNVARWDALIACAKGMVPRDKKKAASLRALIRLLALRRTGDSVSSVTIIEPGAMASHAGFGRRPRTRRRAAS